MSLKTLPPTNPWERPYHKSESRLRSVDSRLPVTCDLLSSGSSKYVVVTEFALRILGELFSTAGEECPDLALLTGNG